jgi:anti-sigma regulatory factor (Ser/Thr protein kinase)
MSGPAGSANDRLAIAVAPDGAGLAAGQAALRDFLTTHAVDGRGAYQTELAFEELVSNVLRHGGRGPHAAPVDVRVALGASAITLMVEDDGPAFDPLAVPEPTLPTRLEDAAIGGLGLLLVRRMSAGMAYERTGGRNRVTVTIARAPD